MNHVQLLKEVISLSSLQRRSDLLHEVIFLRVPGDKIPTWFKEKEHCVHYASHEFEANIAIKVDTSDNDERQWWGIAVCLVLRKRKASFFCIRSDLRWGFKDPNEEEKQVKKSLFGSADSNPHLCIAIFPFNNLSYRQQCHLRGKSQAQLQLHLRICGGLNVEVHCGWRIICKNDFFEG